MGVANPNSSNSLPADISSCLGVTAAVPKEQRGSPAFTQISTLTFAAVSADFRTLWLLRFWLQLNLGRASARKASCMQTLSAHPHFVPAAALPAPCPLCTRGTQFQLADAQKSGKPAAEGLGQGSSVCPSPVLVQIPLWPAQPLSTPHPGAVTCIWSCCSPRARALRAPRSS